MSPHGTQRGENEIQGNKMKVQFNAITMTSRAVEALVEATGYRTQREYLGAGPRSRLHYFHLASGKWLAVGDFGRALVAEINEWMGDAGIVDWNILKKAHYSNGSTFKFFSVSE